MALRKQIAEALIGVFGSSEARELAHGPQAAAVHGSVNATHIRRLAGLAEVAIRIPVRKIGARIQAANRVTGKGGEFRLAFGGLLEGGAKRVLFPGALFG